MFKALFLCVLCLFLGSCRERSLKEISRLTHNTQFYKASVKKLTEVIVHDIFGPTVAARIYVYPSIAAYEVIRQENPSSFSYVGKLHGLRDFPQAPHSGKDIDLAIAAVLAYDGVSQKLVFSEEKVAGFRDSLLRRYRGLGVSENVLKNSDAYALKVQESILKWVKGDNYGPTRSYPKYTITSDPRKWQPTPPGYMDGNEPNWRSIRPLVIDSAAQFKPPAPTVFSTLASSRFYQQAQQVFLAGVNNNGQTLAKAAFWDCNPFALNLNGHAMFASKKISPGGHWQLINLLCAHKAGLDLEKTCFSQSLVSVAIFDGFITCWDEKYRSQLVRPETYINKYIDPSWKPFLQTPPFPEYPSGHSVISTAASRMMDHFYGDKFSFADSSELIFGLPVRQFSSLDQAAGEAAISRLYGGIHYMPAITNGSEMGRKVAEYTLRKFGLQH